MNVLTKNISVQMVVAHLTEAPVEKWLLINNAKWCVYSAGADCSVYPSGQALQLLWPSSLLMVPLGHCRGAAKPPGQ